MRERAEPPPPVHDARHDALGSLVHLIDVGGARGTGEAWRRARNEMCIIFRQLVVVARRERASTMFARISQC